MVCLVHLFPQTRNSTPQILAVLTCGEGNHNFVSGWTIVKLLWPKLTVHPSMSVHLKWCERKSKLQLKFQHAFPHDFRSGPSLTDWDPTKWTILLLQFFGFATKLRRARDEDINNALIHMRLKEKGEIMAYEWSGELHCEGELLPHTLRWIHCWHNIISYRSCERQMLGRMLDHHSLPYPIAWWF